MANINKQWKKWMAVGCSHGHLADPYALKTVLEFSERWKPDTRIHLGDYVDTAAFRTGAKGTKDEAVPLGPDVSAAARFLRDYRPTVLLNGNHDIRLWRNATHPNAIVAGCAQAIINEIRTAIPKDCTFIESYAVRKGRYQLGDTTFVHGWKCSVNAIRDTAKSLGKCVMAHLHRVGLQPTDRSDGAVGYCTGYLGDPDKFEYAEAWHGILEWSNGFSYGEYTDTQCEINLSRRQGTIWRLPL